MIHALVHAIASRQPQVKGKVTMTSWDGDGILGWLSKSQQQDLVSCLGVTSLSWRPPANSWNLVTPWLSLLGGYLGCVCVYLCVCHTRRGHESPNKHGARQTGPTSAAKPPHCYLEHHISSLQTHACTNRHIRLNFAVTEYFSIPLSFKDGCAPAGSFRASRKCLWKTIEPSGHT